MADSTPITQDQYNTLNKKLDNVQKTIDRFYEDFGDESRDLSKYGERLGRIELIVKGIAENGPSDIRRIINKVEDTISDGMQPLREVKKTVENLTTRNPKILYWERPQPGFWKRLFSGTPKKDKGGE